LPRRVPATSERTWSGPRGLPRGVDRVLDLLRSGPVFRTGAANQIDPGRPGIEQQVQGGHARQETVFCLPVELRILRMDEVLPFDGDAVALENPLVDVVLGAVPGEHRGGSDLRRQLREQLALLPGELPQLAGADDRRLDAESVQYQPGAGHGQLVQALPLPVVQGEDFIGIVVPERRLAVTVLGYGAAVFVPPWPRRIYFFVHDPLVPALLDHRDGQ